MGDSLSYLDLLMKLVSSAVRGDAAALPSSVTAKRLLTQKNRGTAHNLDPTLPICTSQRRNYKDPLFKALVQCSFTDTLTINL